MKQTPGVTSSQTGSPSVDLLMFVTYSNIMNMEINAGKVIFPVRFEFVINDVTMVSLVSVMGTLRFIHF